MMNKVEILFENRGVNRNGIILYKKKDSIDFIEQCRNFKIGILGIDGFKLNTFTIQPSFEDSIDFSNTEQIEDDYILAIEFIESREDNLYFEIVCE